MSGAYTTSSDEKSEARVKLCEAQLCCPLSLALQFPFRALQQDLAWDLAHGLGLGRSPAVVAGVFPCVPPGAWVFHSQTGWQGDPGPTESTGLQRRGLGGKSSG